MPTDDFTRLIKDRSLPVVRRGYDQGATDDLLGKLEAGMKTILSAYAEAQQRVAELEKRITEGREREEEITQALVVAARVRAESENEGKELKAEYVREAEALKARSEEKAAATLTAAEAEAEEIVAGARLKARGYEQEIRDNEQSPSRLGLV